MLHLLPVLLIGDDERDIEAGTIAGCKCRMVDEKHTILDVVKEIVALEKKGEDTWLFQKHP